MSSPKPSNAAGVYPATADQVGAYANNLPSLLNATANQVQPIGQTLQNAQNALAPQAQGLQNNLFGSYAPQLEQIGNYLNQINTAGGVNTASGLLGGSGGQLVGQAVGANQQANPQYYSNVAAAGNQLTPLLGSYSPTGDLTGSQTAQLSRGLAQQDAQKGILNAPSQTAAISNAQTFGNLQQQNKQNLQQAIQTATSFLPASSPGTSGINGFNIGSGGATTQNNAGLNQFLQPGQNQATTAAAGNAALGGQLLGGANTSANTAAQVNASFPSNAQLWQNSALNSTPSSGGGGGAS
jgi:hypothetical protein